MAMKLKVSSLFYDGADTLVADKTLPCTVVVHNIHESLQKLNNAAGKTEAIPLILKKNGVHFKEMAMKLEVSSLFYDGADYNSFRSLLFLELW